ncbi:MAG TPA: hypothetical protein VHM90_13365 [Phycisphaerae bacterium]|nr:hypothetical protein [Phycisphaerae bacterium]
MSDGHEPATAVSETPAHDEHVGEVVRDPHMPALVRRDLEALAKRLESDQPAPKRFDFRAPNWLQAFLIFAMFGAALFVAINEHYLWAALFAIAGTAFGASYALRRMVGDEYDRA